MGTKGGAAVHRWSRKFHAWTSLLSLVLLLFFGLTGLLLNHPDWTFGQDAVTVATQGTLPAGAASPDAVDFLAISEHVRGIDGVRGAITGHGLSGTNGWINYTGPGVQASVQFDTATGSYTLTQTRSGLAALLGDIHRGNGASPAWGLAIDATAIFLVLVAVTGGTIALVNRSRHRRRDLLLALAGAVAAVGLVWTTLV